MRILLHVKEHIVKALVIEDDAVVAEHVISLLQMDNFDVTHASDGAEGLKSAAANFFNLIVLDRSLPSLDGLSILQKLRALEIKTPVIILSALGRVEDRVMGLENGADDYLVKPFADSELLARVRALVRRDRKDIHPEIIVIDDLEIRIKARTVHRGGKHIAISRKEFELLKCLAENVGQYMPRQFLLEQVWNLHFDPQTNVVDVHISRLRRKLDEGFEGSLIKNVRGEGYKLEANIVSPS